MKKIAIFGAGGFGRETRLLINQINASHTQWEFIGFFDDNQDKSTSNWLGGIEALNAFTETLYVVIAIAEPEIRKSIVDKIANSNMKFATLIHPSVIIDKNEVNVGEGSIITAYNVLTTNIEIGNHVIVNLSCTTGHDVKLGDYCAVMPGTHLSGNVNVEEGVLIGTGARLLQNLTIGAWSKIGAGAVVIRDVDKKTTVVGVPAQPINK